MISTTIYVLTALGGVAFSFGLAFLLANYYLREPSVVDRGVINPRDLNPGYYVAKCNHGKPVPTPGTEEEVVFVTNDENGNLRVYAKGDAEGYYRERPLQQFTYLREWHGEPL